MKIKREIELYLNVFIIAWGTYALFLTPLMFADFEECLGPICIKGVDMTLDQYISWLWQGALVDLVLAYFVGRLIIWRKDYLYNKWK